MIRFKRIFLAIFVTAPLLVGCSLKLQVALFNDTGEVVMVKIEGATIAIQPGRFGQFDYPAPEQNGMLYLATAACDYAYQAPRTLDQVAKALEQYQLQPGERPLKVQVERDFGIYVLPPWATAVAAVGEFGSLQQDGFPVHPVSKKCH